MSLLRTFAVGGVACALLACSSGRPATEGSPPQSSTAGRVITSEMIARWNVLDAYAAIERSGAYRLAEDSRGNVAVRQRRGQTTLTNPNADRPVLVVDGTIMGDFGMLRRIRAAEIERIDLLSPAEATQRFGTVSSGAGAIIVVTKGRPR